MSQDDVALQELFKKPGVEHICAADIELLANSLTPAATKSARSLAFLNLSKLASSRSTSSASDNVSKAVKAYLDRTFAADHDDPKAYIPFVSLLATLFSLNVAVAVPLVTAQITQAADHGPSSDVLDVLLEAAELPSELQAAVADMLGQAASTKQGREVIRKAEAWLRGAIDYDQCGDLGVLCAVALSKLTPAETSDVPQQEDGDARTIEEIGLAKKMVDHVQSVSSPTASSILPTLEGLSILSTKGHVKHLLASSPAFLDSLIKLSPVPGIRPSSLPVTPRASVNIDEKIFEPVETSLCYGLTSILVNLTAVKPTLSTEAEQIAKLRAMAISGKKGATVEEDPFDDEEAVKGRVRVIIQAGVIPSLRGLVRAESVLVKESLGKLCLNLVYDKADRPVFVRGGGFKVLSQVVRDLLTPVKTDNQTKAGTPDYLPALQALAKLVITTQPHLLFPPPHDTTSLNALSPLYMLLAHPSSTLLQNFEALMALTNLATIDSSIADRIVDASIALPVIDTMWKGSGREDKIKILTRIEELLLNDNTLVRRAATELVCNLITSPKGQAHFAGEPGAAQVSARVRSRLNVLLVLASIEDTPTRLAASGALAMLTKSPNACAAILSVKDETSNRSIWKRLLGLFEPEAPETDEDGEDIPVISTQPPNPYLVHRGVIVLFNLLEYVSGQGEAQRKKEMSQAREVGVEEKMIEVIKGNMARREIVEPAVEVAKMFKRYPA